MELLEIDEIQAQAILDMQLRKLAALERNELQSRYDALMRDIAEYQSILASEQRQRTIVGDELSEIVAKYGDERRTQIVADEGDVTDEDLIAERDIVVTLTRGGYAKATDVGLYRAQRRGGRGVKGAQLRGDDVVSHFFVTTTHHWVLFFTTKGRVYRAKGYELPDAGRDARGQHVANLLAFQPDESVAQVLDLRDFGTADYLVLATRDGMVKKSRLREFDSIRSNGLAAINLREGDELISAQLVSADDELMLVSAKGASVRFRADDATLRPMGRATSGVQGIRLRPGDSALSMEVVRPGSHLVTVTDGGYRQADLGDRVAHPGPQHLRRHRHEARRAARLAGRRPDLRGVRRAVRHRQQRRGHPHPGGPGPGHRPGHDGRVPDGPRRGGQRRGRGPVGGPQRGRRGRGRRRSRSIREGAAGPTEDAAEQPQRGDEPDGTGDDADRGQRDRERRGRVTPGRGSRLGSAATQPGCAPVGGIPSGLVASVTGGGDG